jgi:ribose transport system substrate-binding protein
MKMTVGAAAAFALLAASSAAEAAEPAIALVLGVKGSPFYQALACGAKAKAKELGLALTISAPDQFAADSQIPVVNAIAATTPVVAAIVPTDAKALIAPMKQLADRGTKIVTIDQTIEDSSFVQTQILTDNAQGGRRRRCAQRAARRQGRSARHHPTARLCRTGRAHNGF